MDFENIFDKLLTDITHDYSFKVKTKEEENSDEDNSLLPIFQSKVNSSTYNDLINKVSQSLTVNDDNNASQSTPLPRKDIRKSNEYRKMNSLDFILSTGMKDKNYGINQMTLLQEKNTSEEFIKSDLFSIQSYDTLSPKLVENILKENIDDIQYKNTESALQSLDECISKCDLNLYEYLDNSYKIFDKVYPQLESKIENYKSEFSECRDTTHLLENSIQSSYESLEQQYRELFNIIKNEHKNESELILQLQEKTLDFNTKKIDKIVNNNINNYNNSIIRNEINEIDKKFHKLCDLAYEKFKINSHINESEDYLLKIENIKSAIFLYKKNIIELSEEWINDMVCAADLYYLSHLEELNKNLIELRSLEQSLQIYIKKRGHLSKRIEKELITIIQLNESNRNDFSIKENDHCNHAIAVVNQRINESFMFGTRIKALGFSSGLSLHDIEKLLIDLHSSND